MRHKKKENIIQTLIETTSFNQLKVDEKETVLSRYTQAEYEAMHALYADCNKNLNAPLDLTPNPGTWVALNEAWDHKYTQERSFLFIWLTHFLNFRLRAYQVGLIAFLFLGLGYFMSKPQVQITEVPVIQKEQTIVKVIDTVYLEPKASPQSKPRVATMTKRKATIPPPLSTQFTDYQAEVAIQKVNIPNANDISNSFGNSAIEASALEQFARPL